MLFLCFLLTSKQGEVFLALLTKSFHNQKEKKNTALRRFEG